MPIYEFRCQKCSEEFQELFYSSQVEVDQVVCPKCHAQQAEKLLSVFASEMKGDSGMNGGSCGPGCGCHH
jgi:putative FmdB family regulatory protein